MEDLALMKNYFNKNSLLLSALIFSLTEFAIAGAVLSKGEQAGWVSVLNHDKAMPGKFSYIAPYSGWVVEIDLDGVVLNSFRIPSKYHRHLGGGADIEWIPSLQEFLITGPQTGVFRSSLDGNITWSCDTAFISHDSDYQDDGSVFFVNGWDEIGNNEPILTWMSKDCSIIDELRASEIDLREERFNKNIKDKTHTHTNALQRIRPKLIMLSLRNYDEIVLVSLKKRKIVRRYYKAFQVHDPMPFDSSVESKQMEFYYADESKGGRLMLSRSKPKRERPKTIWNSAKHEPEWKRGDAINERLWWPIRTLELSPNGNFLISGSAYLGQVTPEGELVWEVRLKGFENQSKNKDFVYKASFRE